ncbi:unnamed protein product [Didymodactylos carnosus]|uniref:Uncharacterized protein n=1 Tax=Didymodactylos carnosus TaxID=1234261 RepID=A0A814G175_9BILA|nr:unnamed protein product [Didymodactylos carnosus]CAF0990304.1 unnamed protein product [Didymodactylos carnosus]CAF3675542.1 unnamed protein product [Didymodactylos carnosus]CAF3762328.1 unnamed protein product [Didymodactylos carnosus]
MSGYICPHCTECTNLFANGGGQLLAQEYHLPLLGMIPTDNRLNSILDQGIYSNKEDNQEKQFFETAMKICSTMVKQIIEQW